MSEKATSIAETVYIGIGSNLQEPLRQVRIAIRELGTMPATQLIAVSALYHTSPMGPPEQPAYVNAAAKLHTRLSALALLDQLLAIERRHGRERTGPKWGPRTLDLDLLLYGNQVIDHPRLSVPHPGIAERAFVLIPLRDLDPLVEVPGHGTVEALCARVDARGVSRIEERSA